MAGFWLPFMMKSVQRRKACISMFFLAWQYHLELHKDQWLQAHLQTWALLSPSGSQSCASSRYLNLIIIPCWRDSHIVKTPWAFYPKSIYTKPSFSFQHREWETGPYLLCFTVKEEEKTILTFQSGCIPAYKFTVWIALADIKEFIISELEFSSRF